MPSSTSSSEAATLETLLLPPGDVVADGAAFERPGFVRQTASDRPGVAQPVPVRDIPLQPWGQIMLAALVMTMLLFGFISSVVLFFVVFFYLLGALYDDRRDRSILFWKSLPLSDTSTVISKVIAAVIIAPLIAMVVVLAGYIGAQIIMSLWFLAHGVNPFGLLWAHTEPFALWLRLLAMIPVNAVWALPTVGWLLVWSAAVRSKPFLWAVVIPVIAGVLNFWIGLLGLPNIDTRFFWGDLVGRALLSVVPASWIAADPAQIRAGFIGDDQLSTISYSQMAHAFVLPEMWIGAAIGIALIATAIWFRRWRDEA